MNPVPFASVTALVLVAAVLMGRTLRRWLPEHHLNADTKDSVKLAMGLVATMSALLLGLLVSSAKGTYDTVRGDVITMAAKVAFLDRVLSSYGAEATEARAKFRDAVTEAVHRMWPEQGNAPAQLSPDPRASHAVLVAIEALSPQNDEQRALKIEAHRLEMELGQLRMLLVAQSIASISTPLLLTVVGWLVVIFFSFSLLSPPNATASIALTVSALSVSAAIFLILELDRPFGGLIRIPNQSLLGAVNQLAK